MNITILISSVSAVALCCAFLTYQQQHHRHQHTLPQKATEHCTSHTFMHAEPRCYPVLLYTCAVLALLPNNSKDPRTRDLPISNTSANSADTIVKYPVISFIFGTSSSDAKSIYRYTAFLQRHAYDTPRAFTAYLPSHETHKTLTRYSGHIDYSDAHKKYTNLTQNSMLPRYCTFGAYNMYADKKQQDTSQTTPVMTVVSSATQPAAHLTGAEKIETKACDQRHQYTYTSVGISPATAATPAALAASNIAHVPGATNSFVLDTNDDELVENIRGCCILRGFAKYELRVPVYNLSFMSNENIEQLKSNCARLLPGRWRPTVYVIEGSSIPDDWHQRIQGKNCAIPSYNPETHRLQLARYIPLRTPAPRHLYSPVESTPSGMRELPDSRIDPFHTQRQH